MPSANAKPTSITGRRPIRSDHWPATKFSTALTTPNTTTKLASNRTEPLGLPVLAFRKCRHDSARQAKRRAHQKRLHQQKPHLPDVPADAGFWQWGRDHGAQLRKFAISLRPAAWLFSG